MTFPFCQHDRQAIRGVASCPRPRLDFLIACSVKERPSFRKLLSSSRRETHDDFYTLLPFIPSSYDTVIYKHGALQIQGRREGQVDPYRFGQR